MVTSASPSHGIGAYILAGLGLSTTPVTNSSAASSSAPGASPSYTNSSTPIASYNQSLAQCASSWSSWSSLHTIYAFPLWSETTYNTSQRTSWALGTADVYTTSNGIPVASGSFTPTEVVEATITYVTSTGSWSTALPTPLPTPRCSELSPAQCSLLYVSYLASLGLASNATVPSITPAPSNSPACPTFYYQPWSTCGSSSIPFSACELSGSNVRLFYFPPQTTNDTGPYANTTAPPTVVQSYAPGITFTSPSVYLSFNSLQAFSILQPWTSSCLACGTTGCSQSWSYGQSSYSPIGTPITGALLTLDLQNVSTLLGYLPDWLPEASSAANVIAKGLPNYATVVNDVFGYGVDLEAGNLFAKSLQLEDLTHPPPTAYYLNPNNLITLGGSIPAAQGCGFYAPSPECSTIFEGMYRPIVSLPSQIAALESGWADCTPAIFGAYDPPVALTEVTTVYGPSAPAGPVTTASDQATSSSSNPVAAPITTPQAPTPLSTSTTTSSPFVPPSSTPESEPSPSGPTAVQQPTSADPPSVQSDNTSPNASPSDDASAEHQTSVQAPSAVDTSIHQAPSTAQEQTWNAPSIFTQAATTQVEGADPSGSTTSPNDPQSPNDPLPTSAQAPSADSTPAQQAPSTTEVGTWNALSVFTQAEETQTDGIIPSDPGTTAFEAQSPIDSASATHSQPADSVLPTQTFTFAGLTITAAQETSSLVLIAGSTSAILRSDVTAATMGTLTFGVASGAIIADDSTLVTGTALEAATAQPQAVFTGSDSQPITVVQQGSLAIITAGGSTVTSTPGAPPTTFAGQTISIPSGASAAVVGGSTIAFTPTSVPSLTAVSVLQAIISGPGGHQITVEEQGLSAVIAGSGISTTVQLGGYATIEGQTISLPGAGGVVVNDGTTVNLSTTLASLAPAEAVVTDPAGDPVTIMQQGSSYLVLLDGSATTIDEGAVVTYDGMTLQMPTSGTDIQVDGSPVAMTTASTSRGATAIITGEDGHLMSFIQGASGLLVEAASTTFTLSAGAQTLFDGVTFSAPMSTGEVVVDGSTVEISGTVASSGLSQLASGSDVTQSPNSGASQGAATPNLRSTTSPGSRPAIEKYSPFAVAAAVIITLVM